MKAAANCAFSERNPYPGWIASAPEARAAAMKDPAWQAYLAKGPAKLAAMHSTLLLPTNYSPLK